VRRQMTGGDLAEVGVGKGCSWTWNNESSEMLGARRHGTGDNRDVSDRQMAPKHNFHMLGLNSVAVYFYLIIYPAEEMQQSSLVAPDEVASAV
jgi:hypothetical protein